MERIILKHLSGSKAGQVEEFPLKHFTELLIGRDPGSSVQFHPEQDDLVGRRHAKIAPDENKPGQFLIVDLASRNGTFLNRQRIYQPTRISPGDILQLGPGGPEFRFQLDPPVAPATRAPRPASEPVGVTQAPLPPATRTMQSLRGETAAIPLPKQAVGAATVERMIAQSASRQRRSYMGLMALIMALVAVGLLVFLYFGGVRRGALSLGESALAERNRDAVVSVESSWKLYDVATGNRLYHAVILNPIYGQYEQFPAIGARQEIPLFARYPDGAVEPVLSTDASGGQAVAFGADAVGSGFVATPDGFILTSRNVAAGWAEPFRFWSSRSAPGLVAVFGDRGGELRWVGWDELLQPPGDWVPSRARFVLPGGVKIRQVRLPLRAPSQRAVQGRHDYMDVRFAQTSSSFPATLGRVSERYSVAMVKIAAAQELLTAEFGLLDEPAQAGDRATVMGFPRLAPAANAASRAPGLVLADPTIHVGHIGRVMGSGANAADELERLCPGCYQLNVGSVGMSHGGGPVFNEQGEVIGLFQPLITRDVAATLGVPIRVGRQLMGVQAND